MNCQKSRRSYRACHPKRWRRRILTIEQVSNNAMTISLEQRHQARCEHQARKSILIVGNFLSNTVGTRGVCEDLSNQLHTAGWSVVTTSKRKQRLSRLSDMLITCWRQRHHYDVVQVDVYSGTAFLWAEAVCWMLQRIGKPYVL